eukprot:ctg_1255.g479
MQESEPQWLPDLLDELGSTPASESLASDEVENDVERPQSYELPVECVPRPYLNYLRIRDRREPFKRHDKDSGSPEFQIATLTERIQIITEHLKEHRKDNSARGERDHEEKVRQIDGAARRRVKGAPRQPGRIRPHRAAPPAIDPVMSSVSPCTHLRAARRTWSPGTGPPRLDREDSSAARPKRFGQPGGEVRRLTADITGSGDGGAAR